MDFFFLQNCSAAGTPWPQRWSVAGKDFTQQLPAPAAAAQTLAGRAALRDAPWCPRAKCGSPRAVPRHPAALLGWHQGDRGSRGLAHKAGQCSGGQQPPTPCAEGMLRGTPRCPFGAVSPCPKGRGAAAAAPWGCGVPVPLGYPGFCCPHPCSKHPCVVYPSPGSLQLCSSNTGFFLQVVPSVLGSVGSLWGRHGERLLPWQRAGRNGGFPSQHLPSLGGFPRSQWDGAGGSGRDPATFPHPLFLAGTLRLEDSGPCRSGGSGAAP